MWLTHFFFSVYNTLGHFQEDREEGGLEDPHMRQSSKQAAEYQVNICSSRLSKDLFCNKQVAEYHGISWKELTKKRDLRKRGDKIVGRKAQKKTIGNLLQLSKHSLYSQRQSQT